MPRRRNRLSGSNGFNGSEIHFNALLKQKGPMHRCRDLTDRLGLVSSLSPAIPGRF